MSWMRGFQKRSNRPQESTGQTMTHNECFMANGEVGDEDGFGVLAHRALPPAELI
jgi:hypothetical protein